MLDFMTPLREYPVEAILPKEETQASQFLIEHPTFDGRGTIIAILDTGVDPGAVGLQKTTTGAPKIIDLIDCTGQGDVPCNTVVSATVSEEDGKVVRTLKGLTGRTLTIPATWKLPADNKYRLGWTTFSTLFPGEVVNDLKKERKRKFEIEHHKLITDVQNQLLNHEKAFATPTEAQTAERTELKARIEALKEQMQAFSEPGLIYDCVVFYDGDKWQASIDVNESGNLAANHPRDARQNGVAPGAQIVSLKIGDVRVKGMETGTGLVRAAIELTRLKADIANIRIYHDCNSGPTLSTVGAPGGTTAGCVSVGAYATPAMHEAMYNLIENPPETPTTWSSRGPTSDGAVGVDIYPMDFILILRRHLELRSLQFPQYTKNAGQFMNGTSMASPNAAGCYSLLISGLKQENIPYTPYRVTTAIKNSGRDFNDSFRVGFIQVIGAWHHLTKLKPLRSNLDVFYKVSFPARNQARGLYLREAPDNATPQTYQVTVTPRFFREHEDSQNPKKLEFEAQIALISTQRWASATEFVMICNEGRSFLIKVDPSRLPPGLHFAEIVAIDTNQRDAGPLFRIPITVCKPETPLESAGIDAGSRVVLPGIHLTPAMLSGSTLLSLQLQTLQVVLRSKPRVGTANIALFISQVLPKTTYKAYESADWIPLSSTSSGIIEEEQKWSKYVNVVENTTMEIAIGQNWTSLGTTDVSLEVIFHGISVTAYSVATAGYGNGSSGDLIYMNSGNAGLARCDLKATLRREEIIVSISLVSEGTSGFKPFMARTSGVLYGLQELKFEYTKSCVLLDSSLDSFGLQVFDNQKALKNYTVRIAIVSKDIDVLDKLQSAAPVSLSAHKTLADLLSGSGELSKQVLLKGDRIVFWVGGSEVSSLNGKLNLFNVAYIVPVEVKAKDTPVAATSPEIAAAPEPPKDEAMQLREAIRDLEISWLKKITKDDLRKDLIDRLEIAGEKMEKAEKAANLTSDSVEDVKTAAEAILGNIDAKALAEYFGLKIDIAAGGESAKNKKKDMDAQKAALIAALSWRARAIRAALILGEKSADIKEGEMEALFTVFDEGLTSLSRWLSSPPTSDGKYVLLWAWRLEKKQAYGASLRVLSKFLNDPKNLDTDVATSPIWKELVESKKRILAALGWTIWNQYEEKWSFLRSPPDFAPV
ncbi:hypothetical protein BC829DRAFT_418846 [Chytridium lagenaria]|nr:hypothetical protein BC829DRAFT_418846 [Chytridium lagenaria]